MLKERKKTNYYDMNKANDLICFSKSLTELINTKKSTPHTIIILCIGTDRATGDSLGPIIGYKLSQFKLDNVSIYGTLKTPVHAKNLEETIVTIYENHPNPLIIAIDASLGKHSSIGMITLSKGCLFPGSGVNKTLPAIGDIHITGIVNFSGYMEMLVLQNTRLNTVMSMADFISQGIYRALRSRRSTIGIHQQAE